MWTKEMETAYKSHSRIYGGDHTDQLVSESVQQLAELMLSLLKYSHYEVGTEPMLHDYANLFMYFEFIKKNFNVSKKVFTEAVNYKAQQLKKQLDEVEFRHNN